MVLASKNILSKKKLKMFFKYRFKIHNRYSYERK